MKYIHSFHTNSPNIIPSNCFIYSNFRLLNSDYYLSIKNNNVGISLWLEQVCYIMTKTSKSNIVNPSSNWSVSLLSDLHATAILVIDKVFLNFTVTRHGCLKEFVRTAFFTFQFRVQIVNKIRRQKSFIDVLEKNTIFDYEALHCTMSILVHTSEKLKLKLC